MPNWVTNKIKAPSHVIAAIIDDKGNVDFNRVITFDGDWPFDGVYLDAENLAEHVCGVVEDNPLIAGLREINRSRISIKKMTDTSFEQFVQMLRNHRKCDTLHGMDFARKHWGTKWNACESVANADAGTASFDTAWGCPTPVLEALSKRFPDDSIEVIFADEDIGSNCGSFTLKGSEVVSSDIADSYSKQSDEDKAKWRAFAYAVKGWNPEEIED
ncbi:hypothetical protein PQR71_41750 [Paraburkholderia fungorum]|uniref:DUF1281 family ferredoxin-like fold protein n=1 Tax=Paraburkholderia fungorum TaxID=134537 RepID=UPI0038B7BBDC